MTKNRKIVVIIAIAVTMALAVATAVFFISKSKESDQRESKKIEKTSKVDQKAKTRYTREELRQLIKNYEHGRGGDPANDDDFEVMVKNPSEELKKEAEEFLFIMCKARIDGIRAIRAIGFDLNKKGMEEIEKRVYAIADKDYTKKFKHIPKRLIEIYQEKTAQHLGLCLLEKENWERWQKGEITKDEWLKIPPVYHAKKSFPLDGIEDRFLYQLSLDRSVLSKAFQRFSEEYPMWENEPFLKR